MKRTLQIANGVFLIAAIFTNYLFNSGLLQGETMKTVSDRYANYFTPALYAFSIWALIYLALLGFVIYTGRTLFTKKPLGEYDEIVGKIGWWFVISCIANGLWVVCWLLDYTALSVIIMLLLLISLLNIIVNTRMELDTHPFKKYLFIFWPFALYAGWVTVALIANVAAWLTKADWNGWGMSDIFWTIIMVGAAGAINVFMVFNRNLREFAIAGIWGLIAVAIANKSEGQTPVVYTCYTVSALIFISILISAYKNRKASLAGM